MNSDVVSNMGQYLNVSEFSSSYRTEQHTHHNTTATTDHEQNATNETLNSLLSVGSCILLLLFMCSCIQPIPNTRRRTAFDESSSSITRTNLYVNRRRNLLRWAREQRRRLEEQELGEDGVRLRTDMEYRSHVIQESLCTKQVISPPDEYGTLYLGNLVDDDNDITSTSCPDPNIYEATTTANTITKDVVMSDDDDFDDSCCCAICLEPYQVGDIVAWSRYTAPTTESTKAILESQNESSDDIPVAKDDDNERGNVVQHDYHHFSDSQQQHHDVEQREDNILSNGLSTNSNVSRHQQCLHVFHRDCIVQWLHEGLHDDCPSCRTKLLHIPEKTTKTTCQTCDDNNNNNSDRATESCTNCIDDSSTITSSTDVQVPTSINANNDNDGDSNSTGTTPVPVFFIVQGLIAMATRHRTTTNHTMSRYHHRHTLLSKDDNDDDDVIPGNIV